jgi:hypothetical protein
VICKYNIGVKKRYAAVIILERGAITKKPHAREDMRPKITTIV